MINEKVIDIPLAPAQWQKRQQWLADRPQRLRAAEEKRKAEAELMNPDNSVIVPGAGVWVCHGVVEYTDFNDDDAADMWPDKAIWRECPPQPLIAWRVTTVNTINEDNGVMPNLILADDEYAGGFTKSAYGNSPESAIAAARRLLRADRSLWLGIVKQCQDDEHRKAGLQQDTDEPRCYCREFRINFVQAEQ